MAQEKKYDIFISYSRKDSAIADEICKAFDRVGITYFIDRKGIGGGNEFPLELATSILNSQVFLLLGSKNSYESKYTNAEIHFAFKKKQQKSILPYILDDTPMPLEIDFILSTINWRKYQEHPINTILVDDVLKLLGRERPTELVRKDANIEQAKQEALPKGEFQVGDLMYKASEDSGGVTVCKPINKKVTEIHIPSQIQYGIYTYDVDCIGAWAFANNTSLLAINLPNSLKTIGNNAFENCSSLSSLVLPNSIQTIGDEAFKWCSSLKHLEIPSDLERIAKKNFYDYYLRNGIYQNVGDLTSTSVGDFIFDGCSSINLVTLKACSIEEFCKERGNDLLYQLGIVGKRTLKINGVEHPHIIIPLGIKYLGHRSFYNFSSLEGITIPETVEEIDKWTFEGCNSLAVIKYNGTQQQWLSVSKGVGWNKDIPAEVIHCTDGDVKLDRIFRI